MQAFAPRFEMLANAPRKRRRTGAASPPAPAPAPADRVVWYDDRLAELPVDHGAADASGTVHKFTWAALMDENAVEAAERGDAPGYRRFTAKAARLRAKGILERD